MIRYSTTPSADAKAITDSPTAPIRMTEQDAGKQYAEDLDLDAEDNNE